MSKEMKYLTEYTTTYTDNILKSYSYKSQATNTLIDLDRMKESSFMILHQTKNLLQHLVFIYHSAYIKM